MRKSESTANRKGRTLQMMRHYADVSGKRLGETALRREGDVIRFPARVFTDAGAVLAYELVRE